MALLVRINGPAVDLQDSSEFLMSMSVWVCACVHACVRVRVWLGWATRSGVPWGGSRRAQWPAAGQATWRVEPHGQGAGHTSLARRVRGLWVRAQGIQRLLLAPATPPATVGPPVPAGGAAAALAVLPEEGGRTSPDGPDGLRTPGTQGSRPHSRQCWEASHQPSAGKADPFRRVLSMRLALERTQLAWGPWASERTPSSGGRLLGPRTSPCPPESILFWV